MGRQADAIPYHGSSVGCGAAAPSLWRLCVVGARYVTGYVIVTLRSFKPKGLAKFIKSSSGVK